MLMIPAHKVPPCWSMLDLYTHLSWHKPMAWTLFQIQHIRWDNICCHTTKITWNSPKAVKQISLITDLWVAAEKLQLLSGSLPKTWRVIRQTFCLSHFLWTNQFVFFFAVCHFCQTATARGLSQVKEVTLAKHRCSVLRCVYLNSCRSHFGGKQDHIFHWWKPAVPFFPIFFNAKISPSSDKTTAVTASVFISSAAARLTAPCCCCCCCFRLLLRLFRATLWLPALVTTKRMLTGNTTLRPTKMCFPLELCKIIVKGFRTDMSAIQLNSKFRVAGGGQRSSAWISGPGVYFSHYHFSVLQGSWARSFFCFSDYLPCIWSVDHLMHNRWWDKFIHKTRPSVLMTCITPRKWTQCG